LVPFNLNRRDTGSYATNGPLVFKTLLPQGDEPAVANPSCHSTDVEPLPLLGWQLSTEQLCRRSRLTLVARFRRDEE
jgi:hypothetical protein